MKYFKILIFLFYIFTIQNVAVSAEVYFVDIKQILNQSKAGKEAQNYLKTKKKK